MNDKLKGTILVILSACAYGVNPLIAVKIYHYGCTPALLMLLRTVLPLPLLYLSLKANHIPIASVQVLKKSHKDLPLLICTALLVSLPHLFYYCHPIDTSPPGWQPPCTLCTRYLSMFWSCCFCILSFKGQKYCAMECVPLAFIC